ncbi:MSHA biogenesis protein MshK [Aeromonas schubertii]|uniref:MSHA biogenesis protein MshK n=1 Tax=Aeromonas schubertii TaxID=652 RepID=A0A0S2SGP7_9GAMM|nr:MSHA biogenesis protein MshK [Aeromonas schubertii]ALP40887.1 MSHA biogenesis protein MshK [Aeromonas schubertii]MBZ6067065.1 MSHA biogenesis protein MshK [Aeromonas schubertii]MBZ6074115.1 MSHA biogenesis protein MshK [Aeromonas schubertii]
MASLLLVLGAVVALGTPLKDPTTPLSGGGAGDAQVAAAGLPRLQSIVLGNGPALAVLGGKSYRQGDQVAGWRISSITGDRVMLERGQEKTSLTLFGDKVIR